MEVRSRQEGRGARGSPRTSCCGRGGHGSPALSLKIGDALQTSGQLIGKVRED